MVTQISGYAVRVYGMVLTHCYNAYCTLHPDPYAEAKSRWEPGKTNRELDLRVISICCRCNYCSFYYSRILHPSGPRQPARILQGSALPCRLFADHRLPFRSLRPYSLTPLPPYHFLQMPQLIRSCAFVTAAADPPAAADFPSVPAPR